MDKRHYYRVLGVREGAGAAEIKQAYDRHMRRLGLPDYADDPEYVARKKDQIRHAYSALVGGSAPAEMVREKIRLERRKDAEDAGEDALDDLKRKFKKHVHECEAETDVKISLAQVKQTINETLGTNVFSTDYGKQKPVSEEQQKKILKLIVSAFIAISIFGSLITSCAGLAVEIAEEVFDGIGQAIPESEFLISEESSAAPAEVWGSEISAETVEQMEKIMDRSGNFDFLSVLDLRERETVRKVAGAFGEKEPDDIWLDSADLLYALGLPDMNEAIWYITGDEDYYWEHSDYENAQILVSVLDAPEYDYVYGGKCTSTDEIILDYGAYLRFLTSAVSRQADVLN